MRKINLKLVTGVSAMVLGLILIPSGQVNAATGIAGPVQSATLNVSTGTVKTVTAGKTVTITQEKCEPCTLKWTAPKTGYFLFSLTNRKYEVNGEPYPFVPLFNITVKINGKKENVPYLNLISRSGDDMKSIYFNCDKGTKVEITFSPQSDLDTGTFTSDFKLDFTAPKYAVGLKNKSRKTATTLKQNKKYTTVARRDACYYGNNSKKKSQYDSLIMVNLQEFNKYANKFDIDWYKFKAPKKGVYLFTAPSTVAVYVTDKKGKTYMGGQSHGHNNKMKEYQNVNMKKGDIAYFAVLPTMINVPDKEYGTKSVYDGYLYTVHIKYDKKLTKLCGN